MPEPAEQDADEQHEFVIHAQVLGEILAHTHDVEMIGEDERQHDQRQRQIDDLIPSAQHHGKMARLPRGQRLCHLKPVGEVAGHAIDDIAEHDAHQRHHDRILELNALDEPDEEPCSQQGKHE